jgi:hypothetical protein
MIIQISEKPLRDLIGAAESYAEDLSTGLDDGTYDRTDENAQRLQDTENAISYAKAALAEFGTMGAYPGAHKIFPDFVQLPVPEGFYDRTDRDDTMPNYYDPRSSLWLFTDFEREEDREVPGRSRFQLYMKVPGGDADTSKELFMSDSWDAMVGFITAWRVWTTGPGAS